MSSSLSNQTKPLSRLHGTISLPKIATTTDNTIDCHLARIVAGNAGRIRIEYWSYSIDVFCS